MAAKLWYALWTIMFSARICAAQDVPANTSLIVTLTPLDLGAANPDLTGSEGLPNVTGSGVLSNVTWSEGLSNVTGSEVLSNDYPSRGGPDDHLTENDYPSRGGPDYHLTGNNYPSRGGPDDHLTDLDYSYDYYSYDSDGTFPPIDINDTVRKSFLHKCQCEAHQVLLANGTCVNSNTLVQVLHPHELVPIIFNTSDFSYVGASKLNCKDNFFTDHPEHFIITPEGSLFLYSFGMYFSYEDYCIEHLLTDAGGPAWKASICLPAPPISTCCKEGEVLAPGGNTCTPYKGTVPFTPPVNTPKEELLGHHQLGSIHVHDIGCSRAAMEEVELNGETAILHYALERPPQLAFHNKYMLAEHPEQYCLAARETEEGSLQYFARICYQDPCINSTCVRKCCHSDMHLENGTCTINDDEYPPMTYTFHQKENRSIVTEPLHDLHQYFGELVHCTPDKGFGVIELTPKTNPDDIFYLLNDGSLYLPHFRKGGVCGADSYYFIDSFCMDTYMDEDGEYPQVVMFCHKELEKVKGCEARPLLYSILMGISCVFLVLTLIVYIGVPNLRERTYGRCLISLVVSILVFYMTLIFNYVGILESNASCYSAAFIGHFSSLAMFFWLSVMGFDMWSTLRSSRPQSQSKKLFTRYSLYAWGFPLAFALIALIIRLLPETEDYCHIIRPDYVNHGRGCSFNSLTTRWVYQYWVILLLTIVNMFFFVHVTITLIRNHRQTKTILQSPNSSQSNFERQKKVSKMWLYIKLFLVMGITWFMEIISFKDCGWIAGDIFNLLQGVLIFVITVCKKDVFKKTQDARGFKSIGEGMSTLRSRMTVSFGANRPERVQMSDVYCSTRKTSTTTLSQGNRKQSNPNRNTSNSCAALVVPTVHE